MLLLLLCCCSAASAVRVVKGRHSSHGCVGGCVLGDVTVALVVLEHVVPLHLRSTASTLLGELSFPLDFKRC